MKNVLTTDFHGFHGFTRIIMSELSFLSLSVESIQSVKIRGSLFYSSAKRVMMRAVCLMPLMKSGMRMFSLGACTRL